MKSCYVFAKKFNLGDTYNRAITSHFETYKLELSSTDRRIIVVVSYVCPMCLKKFMQSISHRLIHYVSHGRFRSIINYFSMITD